MALTADRVLQDEKVHLVGFSMGGYVASQWAIKHPNKIKSLTLIGYNPEGLTAREEKKRSQLLKHLSPKTFKPFAPGFVEPMVQAQNVSDENIGVVVSQMADDLGALTFKAHISSTTPRLDLAKTLAKQKFAIHIVAGDQDTVAPLSSLKEVAQAISAASFHTVTQSGHMMTLEQSSQIAAILGDLLVLND